MNKLERYSLHSGLKISEPFVNDCFYPIVHKKYITFNNSTSVQSKYYEYWQEVVDLISPYLSKENIKILQLGSSKDPAIENTYDYRGSTNFLQNSYIIKNSLLHFNTSDHFTLLSFNSLTPSVSLFSNEPSNSFSLSKLRSKNKHIFLDAPTKFGCSYNVFEKPKTINNLYPSLVASSILDLLNIKNNLSDLKSVFIGSNYNIRVIEVVPDFVPSPNFLSNSLVNLRMDYHFDESNLFEFSKNRKLGIITDKPLSDQFCYAARASIAKLSVNIDNFDPPDFIKILKNFNIPYELYTYNSDSIGDIRIKHSDEKISIFKKKTKKDLDISTDSWHNVQMKSSKVLISNGKKFASKAHWILGEEISSEYSSVIDASDFWNDSEYYIIYNKEENKKCQEEDQKVAKITSK